MYRQSRTWQGVERAVRVEADAVVLDGNLCIPDGASGIVVFVHGSGSSRHSPRNQFVADVLNTAGLGTLLFDLLTQQEENIDIRTAQWRFNIDLLSRRVVEMTKWLGRNPVVSSKLKVGYFGASTGAAAALAAASRLPDVVKAVVSRGGRPDLAGVALSHVVAPTLLIVGERDQIVADLNYQALELLPASTTKSMEIVLGATHLFEETGTLEQVAELACGWFRKYLAN